MAGFESGRFEGNTGPDLAKEGEEIAVGGKDTFEERWCIHTDAACVHSCI